MIKIKKIPNEIVLNFVIGTIFGFVSDFDIRISDFASPVLWVSNFVDVVLLNI